MKLLFFLYSFTLFHSIVISFKNKESKYKLKPEPKIINGEKVPIETYPSVVRLQVLRPSHLSCSLRYFDHCGGTIISQTHVLTSAFCVKKQTVRVIVGTDDRNALIDPSNVYYALKIIVHERYDETKNGIYDIALVIVSSPIKFGRGINKISLPKKKNEKMEPIFALGFGIVNYKKPYSSRYLRHSRHTIALHKHCTDLFSGHFKNDEMICSIGIDLDQYTCRGDSGFPLIGIRPDGEQVILGIAGYGPIHCQGPAYSAFVRVFYYIDWIQKKMSSSYPIP